MASICETLVTVTGVEFRLYLKPGGEPAVDLVDGQADDRLGRRRRRRRRGVQSADRGGASASASQGPGLRIVVLEGADRINMVGQGTPVPTMVEVRDHNDLPVAGASVVFALDSGGATASLNAGLTRVCADDEYAGTGGGDGEPR